MGTFFFCAKRGSIPGWNHVWRPEAHVSDYRGEPTRWVTLKSKALGIGEPDRPEASRPGVLWGGGVDLVMN